MNKVSLVIPLYKSEAYLEKMLDSVVGQTYSNLEIILVDDGSPDNSGRIADAYKENDKRIIVVHMENSGCCEARNAGVRIATGKYLMFVDGDDWLEPDCVEYLVKIAEENECEMSTTDAIFTTRDRVQNAEDNVRVLEREKAVASIINTFFIPVGPWNKLYTMDVVRKNGIMFDVPWFGEGLYFSTMNAQYSNKMAVGHKKVYNYRLNNPNSGCTVKEVGNGFNALKNILYIKQSLTVGGREIENALNWHIWVNNFVLMTYIYNASAVDQYNTEFKKARLKLKKLMPKVMEHESLSLDNKIKIILKTIAPIIFIKRGIRKEREAFVNDKVK